MRNWNDANIIFSSSFEMCCILHKPKYVVRLEQFIKIEMLTRKLPYKLFIISCAIQYL